jgi:tetratricopeptide (TPR) repeat protein
VTLKRLSALLAIVPCLLAAQSAVSRPGEERIRELYSAQQYQEAANAASALGELSPEANLYYGLALARLNELEKARSVFQQAAAQAPGDSRFPIQLAGVAFRQEDYGESRRQIRRALRLAPSDEYALNFLGTLYLLEQNVEAALSVWNRIQRPVVERVLYEPEPTVNPVLLDRAFAVAPASLLRLEELRMTRARLDHLDLFSRHKFDLVARPNQRFDLVFRSTQRAGLEQRGWASLAGLAYDLPFQTVSPQFVNVDGNGLNVLSSLRWDPRNRWLSASASRPWQGNPALRYELFAEARRETWDVNNSIHLAGVVPDLNLRYAQGGATLSSVAVDRLSWDTSLIAAHRSFWNPQLKQSAAGSYFTDGFSLSQHFNASYRLIDMPEQRFRVAGGGGAQFGKVLAGDMDPYGFATGTLAARWLPRARGDDYQTTAVVRVGGAGGGVPFDKLFFLGVERDTNLWLRGHPGRRDGKKGNAPLAKSFFLFNSELDKNVYDDGFFGLQLGPFVDIGKGFDPTGLFGSEVWLVDVGAQAKLSILGSVSFTFSYGRNVQRGQGAFFITSRGAGAAAITLAGQSF